jgi:hypothetical protein
MISSIFHFVFGMAEDFGGKPFSLVHYLSIKSAIVINKPDKVYFHYQYEPEGEWWSKAKELLTLNKITAPKNFLGNELCHVAHQADVIRLQVLKEFGGVYLDLDTICVKPIHDLYHHKTVFGEEQNLIYIPRNWRQQLKINFWKLMVKKGVSYNRQKRKISNAVILAEKESSFIKMWLDSYRTFRSKGRDKYWNEHSGIMPLRLLEKADDAATLLGPFAFHYPLYSEQGLKSMFEEVNEFPEAYLHHLWESFSWDKYLSKLTPEEIKTKDTTYNLIARRFL